MKNNVKVVVLILGANGTLGTRITALLGQLIPAALVITASRSSRTLHQHEHRYVDLTKPSSYRNAFRDVHFIIHAAGPFNHDPAPLLTYCLDHNIHYLDIAEDLVFLKKIANLTKNYTKPQSYVIPGCSTIPGLVSVLSQSFKQQNKIKKIQIFLNMGSKNPVSLGLIFGLLRPLGTSMSNGQICFNRLHSFRHNIQTLRYYGAYPNPFSEGMVIGKQNFPVQFYVGFDRHLITYSLSLLSPLLRRLSDQSLRRLCRLALAISPLTRLFGTLEGRLRINAMDKNNQVISHIEVVANKDGLNIPASQVVWAVKKLMAIDHNKINPGLLLLPALISNAEAINYLRQQGYVVDDIPRDDTEKQ